MLVGIPALSFTSCGTSGKIIQLQKKKKKCGMIIRVTLLDSLGIK